MRLLESLPAAETLLFKRSGRRPLRVTGRKLASGSTWAPGSRFWFDVELYEVEAGVAAVRRCCALDDCVPDLHEADVFATAAEARHWLVGFDATGVVPVAIPVADTGFDVNALLTCAESLAADLAESRSQYQRLIRQLLPADV